MTAPRVRNIAVLLAVAFIGAAAGHYVTFYRDYLVTTYNYGYASGYNSAMYKCVFGEQSPREDLQGTQDSGLL